MSKLEIGNVLAEDIPALFVNDQAVQAEALSRFRSDLEQLDVSGDITKDTLEDLVFPNSYTHVHFKEEVDRGLSRTIATGTPHEFRMFMPGASIVYLNSHGAMKGVYDDPNPGFSQLDAYGNRLKWALMHAGYAAIAHGSRNGEPESLYGYPYVENIIRRSKGLETIEELDDVRLKDLHHIGGAVHADNPERHGSLGTRLCAASGVLLDERVSGSLIWSPATEPIGLVKSPSDEVALRVLAKQAWQSGALKDLDGRMFEGNLFAGSIDSALARFILRHGVAPIGLEHVIEEGLRGVNVH